MKLIFKLLFFTLFILMYISGCNTKVKSIKNNDLNIRVGIFGGSVDTNEIMFDGDQELEYIVNNKYLGESDSGAQKLFLLLQNVKEANIHIENPATSFIGSSHQKRGGLRENSYKYPYIKNELIRKHIKTEIDRIRGWSDLTPSEWELSLDSLKAPG
jgi:hypothetical protein